MNGFQLKEYWKYRRTAKGRHGVHSPAVYRFIDEALRPSDKRFRNVPAYHSDGGAPWQRDMLMRRIVHHFHFKEIITRSDDRVAVSFKVAEPVSLNEQRETFYKLHDWQALSPENWIDHLKRTNSGQKDVIAVSDIHQSPAHLEAWQTLIAQPEVRLSIDLFRLGLLFFSEDFKERQHFVLKYPA